MKKLNEYIFNPALFWGIGIFPLLVICTSLKSALIFGVLLFLTLQLCNLLISAFKPIISNNVRIACYALTIFSVVYFLDSALYELLPNLYSTIHVFVAYLFSAVIVMFMFESTGTKESLKDSFRISFRVGVEYVISMVVVGTIRELLANGEIYEKTIISNFNGFEFFETILGGLLIVCIYALIYNAIAYYLRKRRMIFLGLVDRYTLFLEQNTKVKAGKKEEGNL